MYYKSLGLNWILLHHKSVHLYFSDPTRQIGYVSGLCGIDAGNLFLLDRVIITRCWVFCLSL